jgi:hypothetical protein
MSDDGRLIDPSGNVRVGIFPEPIREVNFRDFRLCTPFGRPRGPLARHFGFNQFQFLGVLSEELVLGCAIADVKLLGTSFVYCYEPPTRRLAEVSFKMPLAIGTRFNQTPETGTVSFRREEPHRMIGRDAAAGSWSSWRGVSIDAVFRNGGAPPMQPCSSAPGGRDRLASAKTAGVPVTGTVRWEGRTWDLAAISAFGHHDWSAGYMRRETFWNWGCLAGRATDGRVVGMNVSCGVNETSFTENCFWVDGRLHKIDTVRFEHDREDLDKPWRLSSFDGRLRLEFRPEGRHAERVNAGFLATNFTQLFGRYHGRLEIARATVSPSKASWATPSATTPSGRSVVRLH